MADRVTTAAGAGPSKAAVYVTLHQKLLSMLRSNAASRADAAAVAKVKILKLQGLLYMLL